MFIELNSRERRSFSRWEDSSLFEEVDWLTVEDLREKCVERANSMLTPNENIDPRREPSRDAHWLLKMMNESYENRSSQLIRRLSQLSQRCRLNLNGSQTENWKIGEKSKKRFSKASLTIQFFLEFGQSRKIQQRRRTRWRWWWSQRRDGYTECRNSI